MFNVITVSKWPVVDRKCCFPSRLRCWHQRRPISWR